jgi:hypothetical protein
MHPQADTDDKIKNELISSFSSKLQEAGYLTESSPNIPGVQGLLYAHLPGPSRIGFAKVEDHFLLIDWGNAVFSHLDLLLKTYQNFSKFVNRNFHVPHALRLCIPNLAVVAISQVEFPAEIIHFARTTYFNPWYGGETGQLILVDLEKKAVFCHTSSGNRQPGALPLGHAVEIIQTACQQSLIR